jgi:hypothetical protein
MPVWITLGLLRIRVLARIGLARPAPRFVYCWVTDAETGKLFCIWLPTDAAETRPPACQVRPVQDEDARRD